MGSRLTPWTADLLGIERPVSLRVRVGPEGGGSDTWRLTFDDSEGRGFVSITGPMWSASYWWALRNRGQHGDRRSLLRFVLGCDIGYLSGKFGVSDDFDSAATERACKVALYEKYRDRYADLRDTVNFHTQRDWEQWITTTAPGSEAWEVFRCHTQIRPDFRMLYETAWPMLRERRDEIEAAMYPHGLPPEAPNVR